MSKLYDASWSAGYGMADDMIDTVRGIDKADDLVKSGNVGKWTNLDGSVKWPINDGAVPGTEEIITMKPGEKIGRIGSPNGRYTAPSGTPPEKLSLFPETDTSVYTEYEVIKEIPGVNKAEVAPWFDQPGGGIQHKMPKTIRQLERDGFIKKIGE